MERNLFGLLCDDVIIYVCFFLPPRDIVKLRLMDNNTNRILSSCDYLWRTLLVIQCKKKSNYWKELSDPPPPFKTWCSCFLLHYNSLVDKKNKLCYRIYRNTTTKFVTRFRGIQSEVKWDGRSAYYYLHCFDVEKLHVRIFNFGEQRTSIDLNKLVVYGNLIDPNSSQPSLRFPLKDGIFTSKRTDFSTSFSDTAERMEYCICSSNNNGSVELDSYKEFNIFVDGGVRHDSIQQHFDSCSCHKDVEKFVFFLSFGESEEGTNYISVKSENVVYAAQRMSLHQSKKVKNELEDYFKKNKVK